MTKKNFLLLSLDDDKTKKIANTITNTSCKKILDYLADNEATETEISNKLKIPMPTVHYNLKQLMQAKLIEWDNYHYSEKGKEVKHYKIANKYIIIAPKGEDSESFREKLKNIIPTFFITIFAGLFLYKFNNFNNSNNGQVERLYQAESIASDSFDTKSIAYEESLNVGQGLISTASNDFYWFIIGAVFALTTYIIIVLIRKKFKK